LSRRGPATPEQLSEAALEAFWREQDDVAVSRGTRSKWWLRVALVLLAISAGAVLARGQLEPRALHGLGLGGAKLASPLEAASTASQELLVPAHVSTTEEASSPAPLPGVTEADAPPAPSTTAAPSAHAARSKGPKKASVSPSADGSSAVGLPSGSTATAMRGEVPSATTPEYAKPGSLHIDSQPWAQVFIDDQRIGNTPQRELSLSPGLHSVRLYNPELSLLKIITLDVRPGERIERVELLRP
jgi:hypothetical protein